VTFLVDNQLPPALAHFIRSEFNVPALHVVDVGLRDGSDAEIWNYVSENDFDSDFKRRGLRKYGSAGADGQAHLDSIGQLSESIPAAGVSADVVPNTGTA
jgi:hypothetical protein